jgi:hypothetical protein
MLKSKQSRLAKKMKHARLSTKYFHPASGCVSDPAAAAELSRLERDFVGSVPDPVERSEVSFHMGREWREHLANRCQAMRVRFDGRAWLSSVEDMERRLAFEKERHRLARRRFMMGKAMERDARDVGALLGQGVFVDDADDGGEGFELVVEKSVSNSIQAGRSSWEMGCTTALSSPYPSPMLGGYRPGPPSSSSGGHGGGADGMRHHGGGAGGGSARAGRGEDPSVGSCWTENEPNFKHAAPFLSGIASYIERNGVPFEHVDVWVPSVEEGGGGIVDERDFRLRFGGSVTMGVQIVSGDAATGSGDVCPDPGHFVNHTSGGVGGPPRRASLSSEDKFNLSLFGDYSQKFSFKSGCGLPGRIFKSGIPAWEQFVCQAPSDLFERRGGAMQFGLKTAVGMPIDSPNVGRVVLVLYSKHDRAKDEGLVSRMMCDLKLLCPAPRWKLVVDVYAHVGGGTNSLRPQPPAVQVSWGSDRPAGCDNVDRSATDKDRRVKNLLGLLASNIPPSEMTGPLGPHLQNIMSLRLILLRDSSSRTPEEEQLVDTVLVLYESYLSAGRKEADIVVMVARDFAFHVSYQGGGLAMGFGSPSPGGGHRNQQQQQQAPYLHGHTHGGVASTHTFRLVSMHPGASPREALPSPAIDSSPLMGSLSFGGLNAHQQHGFDPSSSPPRMGTNPMMNYNHSVNHHQHQHQQSMGSQLKPFYRQVSGMSPSSISVSPKSYGSR